MFWQLLRAVIWFTPISSVCIANSLSWTCILLLFATYGLLILYFASLIDGKSWEEPLACCVKDPNETFTLQSNPSCFEVKRKVIYYAVFLAVCFFFILFISGMFLIFNQIAYNITICVLEMEEDRIDLIKNLILYFGRIPPTIVFFTLFVLLLFYGIRLIIFIRNDVGVF